MKLVWLGRGQSKAGDAFDEFSPDVKRKVFGK
jgi:hypothetical protein